MHDKLKLLLDKINIEEEFYSFFNDGKIKKLIINKEDKEYHFILELNDVISYKLYKNLITKSKEAFSDLNNVKFTINLKNINKSVKEIYIDILEDFNKKSLDVLKDNNVHLENNKIIIETSNKAENNKIDKIKEEFESKLNDIGINYTISAIINSEHSKQIKEEIKKETENIIKVSKKTESTTILGQDIKNKKNYDIKNIISEDNNVVVEAYVFDIQEFESSKSNFKIITLKLNDFTDSIYCKIFTKETEVFNSIKKQIKINNWYKIRGYVKNDAYSKDLVLNARDIVKIKSKFIVKTDDAIEKRVELHTHTFMSQMDGVVHVSDLVKRAHDYKHKAIAITDHNCVQAFPDAYNTAKKLNKGDNKIKIIYGAELNVIDDQIDILTGDTDLDIDTTYVVFDVETTGFNATSGDSLIEIGAVKVKDNKIIDRFDELINPNKKIPKKISEFTNITDEMVKDARFEKEVTIDFMKFIGDLPLVAHNAKFDKSFLLSVFERYDLGELNNPVIDTMQLSRIVDSNEFRHSLSALTKRYNIQFDEKSHHRADYDSEATSLVFFELLKKVKTRNIKKLSELNDLVTKENILKFGNIYHVILLAKNEVGIKNLYKIISLANTDYLQKTPRIIKSKLEELREGLLIGSGCNDGEVFTRARSLSDEEILTVMRFYDFIEIQPISNYDYLLQRGEFQSRIELENHMKKIINIGNNNDLIVVATGDVHHLDTEDKIYREIIINQKVPGGGLHYLNKKDITNIPSFHFKTTDEMLEDFDFLDENLKNKIVIENTNKINDLIENVEIIKNKKEPYTPIIENSGEETKEMVYKNTKEIYGDVLPKIVEDRLNEELTSIIKHGFDVIYLISQKLVKKSNEDGYLVGSRGSVGSSFAATMMNITEVNPLPAHYICSKCKTSIFEKNDKLLSEEYSSGYDLPDLKCSCGEMMNKEGQDMPFATFLGFKGDKVPDIDLNFSGEYQAKAHAYTKELFGEEYVFRAGTIGTVADKTAYGFVKGYMEDKNKNYKAAEIERLAKNCVGVKRTTGQHPGGIVVIPNYMDIFDFTPYQYPAEDKNAAWFTTHFDFHAIHDYVLKLDILGHDDPTMLKMLQDITNIDINTIPFDDEKVLSLFESTKALNVTKEQIECEVGTLGIPEFGTNFVIELLKDTKPQTFSELVKISGLSHGTDVWLNNAKDLIENKVIEFKDVIGCRDDIMTYLIHNKLEPIDAFKIMEFVRKGKPTFDPEGWEPYSKLMKEKNIPEWYIESCRKIKYMFPKAHATAYVMMAFRIAYFKVYYPLEYYSAYFSIRTSDYDIVSMINGYESIKDKITEIRNKKYDSTNKENAILEVLKVALEMVSRGYTFKNIDLYKSDSTKFLIDEDNKSLIPPFRSLDGLGGIAATKIVEEREKKKFFSIEDLQNRGKVSQTIIDKLKSMNVLEGMPETSQLSLF